MINLHVSSLQEVIITFDEYQCFDNHPVPARDSVFTYIKILAPYSIPSAEKEFSHIQTIKARISPRLRSNIQFSRDRLGITRDYATSAAVVYTLLVNSRESVCDCRSIGRKKKMLACVGTVYRERAGVYIQRRRSSVYVYIKLHSPVTWTCIWPASAAPGSRLSREAQYPRLGPRAGLARRPTRFCRPSRFSGSPRRCRRPPVREKIYHVDQGVRSCCSVDCAVF